MDVDRQQALVVRVDFGPLSGRAPVVRVADGAELALAITLTTMA
jgi:ribulose kinase